MNKQPMLQVCKCCSYLWMSQCVCVGMLTDATSAYLLPYT